MRDAAAVKCRRARTVRLGQGSFRAGLSVLQHAENATVVILRAWLFGLRLPSILKSRVPFLVAPNPARGPGPRGPINVLSRNARALVPLLFNNLATIIITSIVLCLPFGSENSYTN